MARKATSVSDLKQAILDVNGASGGVIEIEAGVDWVVSTVYGSTLNAFPKITTPISIVTVNGPEQAVIRSSGGNFRFFEITNTGALTLRNITLKDSEFDGDGTAIRSIGTLLTLENCRFENNVKNEYHVVSVGSVEAGYEEIVVQIIDSKFTGNRGGVDVRAESILIDNCIFQDNWGSGILLARSEIFEMKNSDFFDNDTLFENTGSYAPICSIGYLDGTNLMATVDNCEFSRNTASLDILRIRSQEEIKLEDCTFIANFVDVDIDAGIVWLSHRGIPKTLKNCWFEDNTGGLIIEGRGYVHFCDFIGNDGGTTGLIHHREHPDCDNPGGLLIVRESTFERNAGTLVYTNCTNCDVQYNTWDDDDGPDPLRLVGVQNGQVLYNASNRPTKPCPQTGILACCS